MKGLKDWQISLIIAAITFISYSNTFYSPFTWDDFYFIVNNERIKDLSVLFKNIDGSRFLTFLSFYLNFKTAGLNVTGFHLVNIFVHALSGFALFLLLRELLFMIFPGIYEKERDIISLFSAILFVVHPVNTMAVNYICQRFTLMASLFYFLAVYFYIKARSEGINRYFIFSLLFTLFAMKSKEISFTIPLMILLMEFTLFKDKRPWWILSIFLLTLLIIPLGRIDAIWEPEQSLWRKTYEREGFSRWVYLLTQMRVLLTYIRLFFLPYGLRMDYDYPLSNSPFEPDTFVAILVHIVILGTAIYLIRKELHLRLIGVGILWHYIALSVESSIIPTNIIFELRLYLAMPGLIMICLGLVLFIPIRYGRRLVYLAAMLVIVFSVLTLSRNSVWSSERSLWEDNYKKAPGSFRVAVNYAKTLPPEEALKIYEKILEQDPQNLFALNNLAQALTEMGRLDEAEQILKSTGRILKRKENLIFLADLYIKKGDYEKAIGIVNELIKLEPGNGRHHYRLGLIYEYFGDRESAEREYREALRLDPSDVDVLNNLGNVIAEMGRPGEALPFFKKAIRIRGDLPSLYINLGITYAQLGDYDEALRALDRAIAMDPKSREAWYNKAIILYNGGLRDEALIAMKKVLDIDPSYKRAEEMLNRWLAQ